MAETQVPPMLPQCWSSEPVIPLVGSGDIVRKRRKTLQDSDDNGGSDETFNELHNSLFIEGPVFINEKLNKVLIYSLI
ncbi:uncharacterized protein RBU33_023487 isoform 3-T4 [Hipposideros larvatus]